LKGNTDIEYEIYNVQINIEYKAIVNMDADLCL